MEQLSFEALRAQNGLTQEDTAKALSMSVVSYRAKEKGKREFTFGELLTLSKLFGGCSLDLFRHP